MANQSAKKTVEGNKKIISFLRKWIIVGVLCYGGGRIWYMYDTWTRFYQVTGAIMVMLQGGLFQLLMHSAKVKYGATERDIVDPGRDLHGGVMEYIKDVIYLTAAVQVACLFTDYAYLLLLVIPAFLLAKLWSYVIKPYLSQGSAASGANADDDGDAAMNRKERRAKEREARKGRHINNEA